MISIIAGILVAISLMLLVYSTSRFIFIKSTNVNIDEIEIKKYKEKMKQVNLIGSIVFFMTGIFGYLINCEFLTVNDRINGVEKFISFFIIYLLIIWISNKNAEFKLKKEKINIEKDKKLIILMEFICVI